MNTSLATQIWGRVPEYITGAIILEQFDAWYAPETWDVPWHEDDEATALVHVIDELMAEYTDGRWRDEELRIQLHEGLKLTTPAESITANGQFLGHPSPSRGILRPLCGRSGQLGFT